MGISGYSVERGSVFSTFPKFTPHWTVVLVKIRFGSLEGDYSLSKRDMTLEKGLRSQHGKEVQLHDSLGWPRAVNELPRISASIESPLVAIVKRPGKFFANKFSINA